MSPEELKALAEKLEAEAGKRGLERPRTVQRIIVDEGTDIDAELAKLGKVDFAIVRVIARARPLAGHSRQDALPLQTNEKGDEESHRIRANLR